MDIIKDLFLIFLFITTFIFCIVIHKKMLKQQEYFINILSHDLRVSTISQIRALELLEKYPNSVEHKELIVDINNSCHFTLDMINMLLNTFKYEKGEQILNCEICNVTEMVLQACELSLNLIKEKNLNYKFDENSDVMVFADKNSIFKVILLFIAITINNSLSNSVFCIKLERNKKYFKFSISYKGKPLSEEECKRLLSNKSRFSTVGNGIRLELCKKIINFHGGEIFIEKKEGNYNSFIFTLPTYEIKVSEINKLLNII